MFLSWHGLSAGLDAFLNGFITFERDLAERGELVAASCALMRLKPVLFQVLLAAQEAHRPPETHERTTKVREPEGFGEVM